MEIETKVKTDEPVEEYFKQEEVKPLDDISAEEEKVMNVDVIGYK